MDKFKDVKIGDEIFVIESVSTGWRSSERFFISKKVTKITKTQFTICDGSRFQKSGRKIGGDYFEGAYLGGENQRQREVKDESIEMQEFKEKMRGRNQLIKLKDLLNFNHSYKLKIGEIAFIKNSMDKIIEVLDSVNHDK